MTLQRIRRAAAAVLVAALALGAPAHAAGWGPWTAASGWFEEALQWIASLWIGDSSPQCLEPVRTKSDQDSGTLPDGAAPPPPPATNSDYGGGIDPNG